MKITRRGLFGMLAGLLGFAAGKLATPPPPGVPIRNISCSFEISEELLNVHGRIWPDVLMDEVSQLKYDLDATLEKWSIEENI